MIFPKQQFTNVYCHECSREDKGIISNLVGSKGLCGGANCNKLHIHIPSIAKNVDNNIKAKVEIHNAFK